MSIRDILKMQTMAFLPLASHICLFLPYSDYFKAPLCHGPIGSAKMSPRVWLYGRCHTVTKYGSWARCFDRQVSTCSTLVSMPRTRRDRSVSFERSRRASLQCSLSLSCESNPTDPSPTVEDVKEWEDARCPVCMEHPHNAVLLICSSYHKGCRPYMCDTSYRHSNCLDQFRKSFTEASTETPDDANQPLESSSEVVAVEAVVTNTHDDRKSQLTLASELLSSMHKLKQRLVCPLCRGQISGWVVVDSARGFMNSKSRSCACETCEFNGTYSDLRKHARSKHPQVRPTVVDPERESSWRHLERQRDIGDVLSTIQSTFGDDQGDDAVLPTNDHDRGWITIFFLFRVMRPSTSPRSSSWSGTSRARTRAQTGARRRAARLWGLSPEADPDPNSVEDDESSDGGTMTWRRRVRRRLSTPDDEI